MSVLGIGGTTTSAFQAVNVTSQLSVLGDAELASITGTAGDLINGKANTTYVDTELATKADTLLDNQGLGVPVLTAPGQSLISRVNIHPPNNGLLGIYNNLEANVEIDCSPLQTALNGKQDELATGNPSDPDHVKLLESNSIPALMIYPPNNSGAGITIDKDTSNPGAVTIDYTVLSASVTQRAWMSDVQALQEVVENTGNGYYDLRAPATASLIASNAANTGSVAAFNFDGSSVLHGPVTANQTLTVSQDLTVSGNILNTEFQTAVAQAAAAQPGFTTVSPLSMTLDIPSGEFRLEADLSAKQDLLSAGSNITVDVGRGA